MCAPAPALPVSLVPLLLPDGLFQRPATPPLGGILFRRHNADMNVMADKNNYTELFANSTNLVYLNSTVANLGLK
jgi:hypothetical protein